MSNNYRTNYKLSKRAETKIKQLIWEKKINEVEFCDFCEKLYDNTNNQFHAHKMTNSKYNNCKNVHYKNDLILIYKKMDNKIYIDNIGTHSQILRY